MKLAATAVVLALLLLPACTSDTDSSNPPDEGQDQPTAMPEQQQQEDVVSMADLQLQEVEGELEATSLEQLMNQMQSQPRISRSGQNRIYTWTFEDGSLLEATFRPRGAEGSGEGLVLYRLDVRD